MLCHETVTNLFCLIASLWVKLINEEISSAADVSCRFSSVYLKVGTAKVMTMAMIAITIISSSSVKPIEVREQGTLFTRVCFLQPYAKYLISFALLGNLALDTVSIDTDKTKQQEDFYH